MPPSAALLRTCRRSAWALGLCALASGLTAAPALSQSGAQGGSGGLSLSLPMQGGYDFHDAAPASPAQRLRDAPLPDPSTLPKTGNSLHDPNTGADTSAFGTAYTYSNPLNDTTSGDNTVANSASKSGNKPMRTGFGMVVLEWGFPPPPMPKVPGEDLTAAPPPVALIRFAVQANDEPVLDAKSLWVMQRAVLAYGRAALTEITIERPPDRPGCCSGYSGLLRAELIRSGLGPGPEHLLPGHRIRLVLAALPASR